ncbi:MAG: alanine racemase [Eubacteriaceae bacterium]|nr:alanine racemase [Eubacteriaceae bacterium]
MKHRPTWCEIDLDRLVYNFKQIQKRVGPEVEVMPVVKADAYGHGSVECAKTLVEAGAKRFAVAVTDEAIQLRKNGLNLPILVFGYNPEEYIEDLLEWDLIPTVYSVDFAEKLSRKTDRDLKIHIKLDTGMGRLGFRGREESVQAISKIAALPHIRIEGIYSHFAIADEKNKEYSYKQLNEFNEVVRFLEISGIHIPFKHMANSAGIIDLKESHFNMVRPGVMLYGMYPSPEVNKTNVDIKPVKTFKTRIAHIKSIEEGDSVSYGRRFIACGKRLVATLPVGYADGYSRLLTNKNSVIIKGQKYLGIGTVCMDQCMVDITGSTGLEVGDEVILFGDDLPIEEISGLMGTINYEVSCMVKERVPKLFVREGKKTGIGAALID